MKPEPKRLLLNHIMKTIKLPQGLFAKVDDDDYERLSHYAWNHYEDSCGKPRVYRVAMHLSGRKRKLVMARLIMRPTNDEVVDHISGDTLDNRKCNLRKCTKAQNNCNRGCAKNNATGYKGVAQSRGKAITWIARIRVDGREIALGRHKTPELAALAYDYAAIKIHGDYAWLNFPSRKKSKNRPLPDSVIAQIEIALKSRANINPST